ncbi:hypothetical protein X797_001311 [Metarhizium robertsii]|uniref:Uncharacterized protein n=1 Tax=Metarhizium robertsii TaxID=568076 RepID=A0A0A1V9Z0_9HYPO|nr:hypothetical protein X797_001311 [Metarhizium robertsii]
MARNLEIDALVRTKQQTCAITRRLIHPPATLISTASQDSGTVTRYPLPPLNDPDSKAIPVILPRTSHSTTQPAPRRALHPIDRNMPRTHLNTSQRIAHRCPKARKPSPPTPPEDARRENAPGHRAPGQKNPLHPKGKKGGGGIRTPASSIPSVTHLLTAGCPPTLAANIMRQGKAGAVPRPGSPITGTRLRHGTTTTRRTQLPCYSGPNYTDGPPPVGPALDPSEPSLLQATCHGGLGQRIRAWDKIDPV